MWSWLLAVSVALVGVVAQETTPLCPDHCRCFWDHDHYWAAQCTSAATNTHFTEAFPSIQVLNIKPVHKALSVKLAPRMFQRFRNVRILNLSNSSISQIPNDVFFGLRYVSDIDLSYNRIRSINGIVFKNLEALQTLILRGNPLILNPYTTIISDTLKELDMGECGLKTIPVHSFASANRLTHLSLDGNQLQTVFYLSIPNNLRYLNLANNKITNVPTKVLLSLSFLRRIDLSENPVNCTCALMLMQDWFSGRGVALENDLICDSPEPYHGKSLSKMNENELCKYELHKDMQMNKLRYSYKPRDSYHIGSEFNALPTYDVLMADEARKDDTEVLFSNEDTRALGTHLESDKPSEKEQGTSRESFENVEGSGSDGDFTLDSEEKKYTTIMDPDEPEESFEGRSMGDSQEMTESSASINPNSTSSFDEENSSKNQSFEIDSSSESSSSTDAVAGSSSEVSRTHHQTTTEDDEGSGAGLLPTLSESSSNVDLLDEKESLTSTTETWTDIPHPGSVSLNPETRKLETSSEHPYEDSSPTSGEHLETTSEVQDIHTDSVEVSSQGPDIVLDISRTTEEPSTLKEVTEEPILRKKVATDGLERYSDMSTEASISNGTDDVMASAGASGVSQSVTTYIIIAVIALPVIVLILMAACRKKSPRKVRLPQDTESNLGTELQDMDILLPKNGTENGVKVVPKINGAANPADSKTADEVTPVLQAEPELEAEPPIEEPISRQNGATSPIQKTKAKLTIITDSIPKTPVFIHKPYSE